VQNNNITLDSYVISDGIQEKNIYPLLEINQQDKKYVIYSNVATFDNNNSDIMVGEITKENNLIPVNEKLLPQFEDILSKIINNCQKTKKGDN